MKVVVELQTSEERTYQHAVRVTEKDQYSIYIYGENDQILAILSKGDIKKLLTEEDTPA